MKKRNFFKVEFFDSRASFGAEERFEGGQRDDG